MSSDASRLTSKYLKWGTYLAEPLAPKQQSAAITVPMIPIRDNLSVSTPLMKAIPPGADGEASRLPHL